MSCVSFIYKNLIDLSTTSLTATTTNAFFPLSNLKDPRSTKVYRSTGTTTSVVIDLGSAMDCDTFAMVPHFSNGFGFTGNVTVEAHTSDSWGSPSFSVTLTSGTDIDLTFNTAYEEFSATQTYRYWRVTATGSSFVEFSRLYLGKRNTILGRSFNYGWKYQLNDNSKLTKNLYGQRFSDVINRQREFSFSFKYLTKDEVDQWFLINDYNGLTKPMFIKIGETTIANDIDRFSGQVYLDAIPEISNSVFSKFDLSVRMSEGL